MSDIPKVPECFGVTMITFLFIFVARFLSAMRYFKGRDRISEILIMSIPQDSIKLTVDGLALDLDKTDSLSRSIILKKQLPGKTWMLLENLLHSGDCFVDVGANIGYTTLVAGRIVGEKGMVLAFEPTPRAFKSLEKNILLNRMHYVEAFNLACSESDSDVIFYTSSISDEYNSLKPDAYSMSDASIKVKAVALGDFLLSKGVQRVHLMKIDVEGAELLVFNGMDAYISQHKPDIIIFEASGKNTKPFDYLPSRIADRMIEQNYSLKVFMSSGQITDYQSDYVNREDVLCDIICYQTEFSGEVEKAILKFKS